ncbi:peptidase dimerization domain-containing protein, partial [Bittarella massiliensis (ex Durand et al. 2017)]|nr:peptidase dimerization domain-containing protein [Bittarella massiliensis (ex Durand et al. 2017)]
MKFFGRTAHAAAAPQAGRSALDSCEIMNVGVNYLREHVIPEARMHYAYLDVGGTSPNVVQDHACVHYFLRAPKSAQVQVILARVKVIAK